MRQVVQKKTNDSQLTTKEATDKFDNDLKSLLVLVRGKTVYPLLKVSDSYWTFTAIGGADTSLSPKRSMNSIIKWAVEHAEKVPSSDKKLFFFDDLHSFAVACINFGWTAD